MAKVIKVACKHCRQEINFPAPPQAGIYVLTCPYCQGQMKVKYNPKPIIVANPAQQPPMAAAMPTAASAQANLNDVRHKETKRFGENMGVAFGMPTPPQQNPVSAFGRLSMVRLGCDKEYFPLHMGDNVVGRKDISKPSDIQIDGDMTISRRSVRITVSPANGGYAYLLTVLNTTNPVIVNGVTIGEGKSVSLAMGTTLVMGQTILRLEK